MKGSFGRFPLSSPFPSFALRPPLPFCFSHPPLANSSLVLLACVPGERGEENIHREAHFKFKRGPITPYSTNARWITRVPDFPAAKHGQRSLSSFSPLLLFLFFFFFTSLLNFPSSLEWSRRPVKIVRVIITEER